MKYLIKEIKKKKELSDISEDVVKSILEEYLGKNNLKVPQTKKEIKIVVKEIRAELRKYVGRFQVKFSAKKRLELLKNGKFTELLKTHSSTKERLISNSYKIILTNLKKISPDTILDLACGINPLVVAPEFPKAKYFASDIKEEELNLLKIFFKLNKIVGEVFVADIRNERKFPKSDVCLLLKVLDIIDKKGHKNARELLEKLNCKNLVISFSTKTISGKIMRVPERKWLESILEDLNYGFKIERSSNEIFYICKLS
tara:strand:- start:45 stop:815 length:771 start_codon:yes stop_codon:yes gene_type:complete